MKMRALWLTVVLVFTCLLWAQSQQRPNTETKQKPQSGESPAKDPFKLEVQGEKAQSAPTASFVSRSELVLVPVIVRNRSGEHVSKLSRDDFHVLQDGVEQKIAIFEEVRTSPAQMVREKLPSGEFSNAIRAESGPQRITIIVLDTINTPFGAQAYAREKLIKYLEQSAESREPTSLLVLTRFGIKVVHDFTTHPKLLIAALRKAKGDTMQVVDDTPVEPADASEAPVVDPGASEADSQAAQDLAQALQEFQQAAAENFQAFQQRVAITLTLDGIRDIAQAYRGVPGRKALLWATAGFPFSVRQGVMGSGDNLHDVLPLYQRTWRALNEANMAVYPVDVRGLVNPTFTMARGGMARDGYTSAMAVHLDRMASFESFAEATGGRAFTNRNDLDTCFQTAVRDSADYYMLGYYFNYRDDPAAKASKKGAWHKLRVKVAQKGLDVRAKSGFLTGGPPQDPAAVALAEEQLAATAPVDYTGIELRGRWGNIGEGKDGKKRVHFQLLMPPNFATLGEGQNRLSVDFIALAKSHTGEVAAESSQHLNMNITSPQALQQYRTNGTQYLYALDVAPGEYNVRFIVRDNIGGRIGSVSAPLTVQ